MSVHKYYCIRSSRKSRPVMMDDSASTHERKKLVKAYKNVLPQKQTAVAEVWGDLLKKDEKMK